MPSSVTGGLRIRIFTTNSFGGSVRPYRYEITRKTSYGGVHIATSSEGYATAREAKRAGLQYVIDRRKWEREFAKR